MILVGVLSIGGNIYLSGNETAKGNKMRTVIITQNIYEYDELSEDAKNNAKEWYMRTWCTPQMFGEDVLNDLDALFGKNNLDIQFNLNCCQGDGLNICGKIDAKQFLNAVEKNKNDIAQFGKYADVLTEDEKRIIHSYCDFDNGYYHDFGIIELPDSNSFYAFCAADRVDISDSWSDEMENIYGLDCDYGLLKKFENMVIGVFTELCNMYKEWGYDFFYHVDDDTMSDACDTNGWEFYENGDFYE